jgi:two-component system cell cycle sensor histidine kinase PleC
MGELALRQRSELALKAAKAESDFASRAKSSFLGTMSHELRTPLNAIIGFSDLIQSMAAARPEDEKTGEYASQIAMAGRHMLAVITDILDISKIESGTFQLNLDDHPLDEIIESCAPFVSQRIAQKKQTLELRIGKKMPELEVDARRIRQIIINLLSNANKFSPEGGHILLSARRNKDGGATIAVVDSGIGMTPEQIELALQPFAQVQSIYTRSEEGTGLGLPIARGLARQHGGDLYIESEPGKGTSVVLTLPKTRIPLALAGPVPRGGGERMKPRRATAPDRESEE